GVRRRERRHACFDLYTEGIVNNGYRTASALAALALSTSLASAQQLPELGFVSVGRAWAHAADIYGTAVVGAVGALLGPPYPCEARTRCAGATRDGHAPDAVERLPTHQIS